MLVDMSFGYTFAWLQRMVAGGIDLTLDDFDRIGSHVPLLVDLQPGQIPHG